jgi:hypothetical protein
MFPKVLAAPRGIIAADLGSMAQLRMASDNAGIVVIISNNLANWTQVPSTLAFNFGRWGCIRRQEAIGSTGGVRAGSGSTGATGCSPFVGCAVYYGGAAENSRRSYDGLIRYVVRSFDTK